MKVYRIYRKNHPLSSPLLTPFSPSSHVSVLSSLERIGLPSSFSHVTQFAPVFFSNIFPNILHCHSALFPKLYPRCAGVCAIQVSYGVAYKAISRQGDLAPQVYVDYQINTLPRTRSRTHAPCVIGRLELIPLPLPTPQKV